MRRDDERDEARELSELLETADVFAQVAQTIVAQVRAMIQHRARYEPVDASDFPGRDRAYYDRIERELSAIGFETLGDFEDAGVAPQLRGQSFVRFALGARGTIAASWFELPTPDGEPHRCFILHSWLDDGRTFITSRATPDPGLPIPANVVVERFGPELDTVATVRAHGERVAATRCAPQRMTGLGDLLAAYSSDERKMSSFREAQGPALFEPMLRSMLGASFEEQGEPILDAIQRHPEWLRADESSKPGGTIVRAVEGDMDLGRFPHVVIARIAEHVEPFDRVERYEMPLEDALFVRELGAITGGGSQLSQTGEISFVEIELSLADVNGALEVVRRVLEEAGAPSGSRLLFQRNGRDLELPVGRA
jgi:hypothetical protein